MCCADPYIVRNIKRQTVLPISHAGLLTDGPDLVDTFVLMKDPIHVSFNLLAVVFSVILKHTDSFGHMQVSTSTCSDCREQKVIIQMSM